MNIEREVRKAIQDEVAPYRHLGASVSFFNERNDRVRARFTYRGQAKAITFTRQAHKVHTINDVVANARTAMRHLGIIEPKPRIGTLGQKMAEAAAEKLKQPHLEPQMPLCPDAIAEEAKQMRAEPDTHTSEEAMTQTTPVPVNGHASSEDPGKRASTKLTREDVVMVTRLLILNGQSNEDSTRYTYNPDWSDERIRDIAKPAANVALIVDIRRKSFGRLESELRAPKPNGPDGARIAALEAEVASLKAELQRLSEKVNTIEAAVVG